jgi:uncharacterized protein YgbK (DUF1537 family)
VIAELDLLLAGLDLDKCILIPANPSQRRMIFQGHYFIDGIPLHQTEFSMDPEYPARSSNVKKILGLSKRFNLRICNKPEQISKNEIVLGESRSLEDIQNWLKYIDETVLPAGASDFFKLRLESWKYDKREKIDRYTYTPGIKRLIVSGSASGSIEKSWPQINMGRTRVCQMPCTDKYDAESSVDCLERWIRTICTALQGNQQVLAVGNHSTGGDSDLSDQIAGMVSGVLEKSDVDELIIEGGSTASQIVRKLGWNSFKPLSEISRGVVVLEPIKMPGCKMIVKPGSYPWPEKLWQYN